MHQPVLLQEVITFLNLKPGDSIVDGTVDGGGHAEAIIRKIMPGGKFLGLDWDERMLAKCESRIANRKNIFLRHGNYADLPVILEKEKFGKADGLLLDLGFSSEQLARQNFSEKNLGGQAGSGRGFSFDEASATEPLLMTYDDSRKPIREVLRTLSEKEIANIIFEFGGERFSRRIARAIAEREKRKPIMFAGELAEIVRNALSRSYERGRIDPATRTFQAFRIYANDELGNLEGILGNLDAIIKPGGRAVIISFHSLEDRIVKRAFLKFAKEKKAEILTKKPIIAQADETKENPRSRSAKLRAIKVLML
jgi:16S rRNA (cytosine1402-N4)-methyltransferase